MAYGTVPSTWIQAGAFPSLKTLDLSNAYLDGFAPSWYAQAKLGGMPTIQNLFLYNPFSAEGGCCGTELHCCVNAALFVPIPPIPNGFPAALLQWLLAAGGSCLPAAASR